MRVFLIPFFVIVGAVCSVPRQIFAHDAVAVAKERKEDCPNVPARYPALELTTCYKLGRKGPDIFDCSGLSQYSYSHVGFTLKDGSWEQATQGEPITGPSTLLELIPLLRRGDLLFFDFRLNEDDSYIAETPEVVSHVGIYEGDGIMIHAARPELGIIESDLKIRQAYQDRFLFARRIIPSAEPPRELIGHAPGELFGRSCAAAGDVDGDGFGDVIIGAPGYNGFLGRVYVYSGQTGEPLFHLDGTLPGRWFGVSVDSVGDVNHDGRPDFVVGNYPISEAGGYNGQAHLYSGADGTLLHTYDGEGERDFFGMTVSGCGDFDGDGVPDVVIGAHRYPVGTWYYDDPGRVYVYSGNATDNPPYRLLLTIDAEPTWNADNFGVEVAGIGDVNGDHRGDIAVLGHRVGPDLGRVYVFYGISGPFPKNINAGTAPVQLTGLSTEIPVQLDGGVSSAGDVNGDRIPDIVFGGEKSSDPSEDQVYVFSGAAFPNQVLLRTFFGTVESHGAGDINHDGYADIVVGAPNNDAGGNDAGMVRLYNGQTGELLNTSSFQNPMLGDQVGERLGYNVSSAGYVNKDLFGDFLIAAPWYDDPTFGVDVGKVTIYFGGPAAPIAGALASAPGTVTESPSSQLSGATNAKNTSPLILTQSYPNPFNAATIISYSLNSGSHVKLEVFDILGHSVATLVNGQEAAGSHQITWNGNDAYGRALASGVYIYRISAEGRSQTKKVIYLK